MPLREVHCIRSITQWAIEYSLCDKRWINNIIQRLPILRNHIVSQYSLGIKTSYCWGVIRREIITANHNIQTKFSSERVSNIGAIVCSGQNNRGNIIIPRNGTTSNIQLCLNWYVVTNRFITYGSIAGSQVSSITGNHVSSSSNIFPLACVILITIKAISDIVYFKHPMWAAISDMLIICCGRIVEKWSRNRQTARIA